MARFQWVGLRFLMGCLVVSAVLSAEFNAEAAPAKRKQATAAANAATSASAAGAPTDANRPLVTSVNLAPAAGSSGYSAIESRMASLGKGLSFDAYLEPELVLSNRDDFPLNKGFTLHDAAFFIRKDFSRGLTASIELPYSSQASMTSSASNVFSLPAARAQAYMQYDRGQSSTQFGQFASTFGFEKNDSRDRFFADAGFIKTYLSPTTFQGVRSTGTFDRFSVSGMVANLVDSGSLVNQNLAYAVQGRMNFARGYATAGVLSGQDKDSGNTLKGHDSYTLIDVMGGYRFDRLQLDASFDSKNTPGFDKATMAYAVFGTYDLSSQPIVLGARFEYMNNPVFSSASPQYSSAWDLAVGPSYRFSDDVSFRGSVAFGNITAGVSGISDVNPVIFNFSILASL